MFSTAVRVPKPKFKMEELVQLSNRGDTSGLFKALRNRTLKNWRHSLRYGQLDALKQERDLMNAYHDQWVARQRRIDYLRDRGLFEKLPNYKIMGYDGGKSSPTGYLGYRYHAKSMGSAFDNTFPLGAADELYRPPQSPWDYRQALIDTVRLAENNRKALHRDLAILSGAGIGLTGLGVGAYQGYKDITD